MKKSIPHIKTSLWNAIPLLRYFSTMGAVKDKMRMVVMRGEIVGRTLS
jgi:hypothetical protein